MRSSNRIVPATERQRAIRDAEEERMRTAYLAQPDSPADADDWSNPEEWRQ
jgi:hypothetical protein